MEVDRSKCLICEVSCHQKGLSFFRFPKEESRLKMWVKEISPLLDILRISPESLKENGRICARHFREKDFINCKQNSLVQNACPSLSVSNLNLEKRKVCEINTPEEKPSGNNQSNDGSERDIFQCGRCKTQFEILSEFIDHKRFQCQLNSKNLMKSATTKTEISPETAISDGNNPQFETLKSSSENNDDKIVSLVVNDVLENPINDSSCSNQVILSPQLCYNGVVINNEIDWMSLAGQVIVTSDGSCVLLSSPNNGVLLTTDEGDSSTKGIIYTPPVQNCSTLPENQVVLTTGSQETEQSLAYCDLSNAVSASQNLETERTNSENRTENEFENFEKLEKPKTKLPCSYCGKIFEKPFNLQQHERVHTGERPFQCIICGRAFTQKSNVRKHMMRHRVWPKGKQTLKLRDGENADGELADGMDYSCQYCSGRFKSYSEHKKHLAVHSDFKVYRCIQKNCNETFSDLDEFLSHSKLHSKAEFQCHICLRVFTTLEELGAHQYDHDTVGKEKKKDAVKLKCQVCHAQFKTAGSLKNHLAVDTHYYECVHCKSVFCSERFLRRHLFIHMGSSQSQHKCPNCKKAFRTQQNLKNHMFIHYKEKPFTCDHCEKQFASKYRLKRHVAIHLNQYFECPLKKHLGCEKTFYRKDKLRDHLNTHNQCRLRSCRICSKTYWTVSKLNKHMRNDHKVKSRGVLKCESCLQTFRKQKQLSHHYCTVEGRKSRGSRVRNSEGGVKGHSETVSNIEIIMVPFGAGGKNLTRNVT